MVVQLGETCSVALPVSCVCVCHVSVRAFTILPVKRLRLWHIMCKVSITATKFKSVVKSVSVVLILLHIINLILVKKIVNKQNLFFILLSQLK